MACAAADAGAGGGVALAGMHDLRLRPRLLRSLLDDCLPLPVPGRSPPRRPADLAYAADAVCSHGLLAEPSAGRADPGVLEEWEAAVDAWVHRLLELIGSDKGGLFNGSWRSEMDLLLIDVATKACYKAGMYEQSPPWTEDPSISDFQLAAFRALLASFLSTHHERPLYLEEGLELFNRGKLETGTELAKFCSHALLALDARIHPRQLHPQYISKIVARDDLGFVSQPSHSVRKHRATDDLGDDCMYRLVSVAIEPVDPLTKDNAVENCTPVEFSGELSMQNDAQQTHIITGEHPPEITAYCLTEEVQAVKMTDGLYDFYNPGDETSTKKCILSGDASSRQNVPNHASGTSTAASVCHSEWDSLDPLLDIGDANLDPGFFPDMVDVDPGSD